MNELIFLGQSLFIVAAALVALRFSKEALIAFIAAQAVFANLFVIKQISLFGLYATASDTYTIGGLLGLNLLQEYYGKAITQRTIWISFFIMIIFAVVSQLHLLYVPTAVDVTHASYCTILSSAPRIVLASLTTYLIVQYFNAQLYGFLKQKMHGHLYIVRNYTSLAISQLLDTVLFSFLGLYGIVHNIGNIIIVSYAIKLLVILLATPLLGFSKIIYQKKN